jgi:4-diphosphocytidyl-2-C-methyl-D-erythritol kinase
VTPLPSLPSTSFVLLVPPLPKVQGKTKRMYSNLRVADFTEGQFVKAALSSLRQGKRLEPDAMFNVFETAAFDFFPRLDKYREILKEAGAPRVYLAGSGPCLFSLFAEAKGAGEVFSRLKKQGLECYLAFSLPGQ